MVVCGGRVCRRRENFDLRTVARLEDFVRKGSIGEDK